MENTKRYFLKNETKIASFPNIDPLGLFSPSTFQKDFPKAPEEVGSQYGTLSNTACKAMYLGRAFDWNCSVGCF